MIVTNIQMPVPVVAPRAARFFGNVAASTLLWFERLGNARTAAAVRRLEATRVSEAAAVRDYARGFASHDPRFAADLLAAADRHEMAARQAR